MSRSAIPWVLLACVAGLGGFYLGRLDGRSGADIVGNEIEHAGHDDVGESTARSNGEAAVTIAQTDSPGTERDGLAPERAESEEDYEGIKRRYDLLINDIRKYGSLRFLEGSISDAFEVSPQLAEFFGLSDSEMGQLNYLAEETTTRLQNWESVNARLLEESRDRIVYEIPPAGEVASMEKERYARRLENIVGEENVAFVLKQIDSVFAEISGGRRVSLAMTNVTWSGEEVAGHAMKIERFDGPRLTGSSTRISRDGRPVYPRYGHLFEIEEDGESP